MKAVLKSLAMKTVLLVILSAATLSLSAPLQRGTDDFELVARLCGRVERIERIPGKIIPDLYTEKVHTLGNVKLRAYERDYNSTCCDKAPLAAETISDKNGSFDFKGLLGRYWLVATVDSHDYRLTILIQQTRDKQPVCSQMSYIIEDSGQLTLRVRALAR